MEFPGAEIVGLFTARAAGEPMDFHLQVEVVPGLGIPEDRYATRLGHWSDPRWKDQQLTFVESEFLDELGLPPSALRRNVLTRGVDLRDLIGLEFAIGTARFRGERICSPCRYIERLNERPGLLSQLEGRGGLRATVLEAGVVHVGDEVRILGLAEGFEFEVTESSPA